MDNYWSGFDSVAYALYDKSYVYLFNHPRMKKNQQNNYQILNWDEQFIGCTLILYNDYPTAIVNIELFENYESLYSILVHELFHGFQYVKGETRFANEILGITYPLTKENVELRNQERANLFSAVLENNIIKKKLYLNTFIALREKRAVMFKNNLLYENLIETIEGPAWYVELKAYSEKTPIDYKSVLKKYGQDLKDKYGTTSDIRRSCYSSGLFMCLLLDEFSPGWKESFWGKEEILYDIFKQLSDDFIKISNVGISSEIEKIHLKTLNNKKEFIYLLKVK
ncbi:peptide ABC transporter permease [Lysinibacillus sp. M3]|uniref:Peptide ABC transporter permease n=1 Tax=Lysinibacillus zambalensis TaxID=3160866 RepID=A0ABV1MU36_9BACI